MIMNAKTVPIAPAHSSATSAKARLRIAGSSSPAWRSARTCRSLSLATSTAFSLAFGAHRPMKPTPSRIAPIIA